MPPKKRKICKPDESPYKFTTVKMAEAVAPPPRLSPKEAKHLAVTLALSSGTTFQCIAAGGAQWKMAYGKMSGSLEKSALTPVQMLEDTMEGVAEAIVRSLAKAEEREFWTSADPFGEICLEGETKNGIAWRFSWRSRLAMVMGDIPLDPTRRLAALKPSREDMADMWASMAAEALRRGAVVRPTLPLGLGFKMGLGLRQPRVKDKEKPKRGAAPAV